MLTLISSVCVRVFITPESKCLTAVNVRTDGAELQSVNKNKIHYKNKITTEPLALSPTPCLVSTTCGDIKEYTTLFSKSRGCSPVIYGLALLGNRCLRG